MIQKIPPDEVAKALGASFYIHSCEPGFSCEMSDCQTDFADVEITKITRSGDEVSAFSCFDHKDEVMDVLDESDKQSERVERLLSATEQLYYAADNAINQLYDTWPPEDEEECRKQVGPGECEPYDLINFLKSTLSPVKECLKDLGVRVDGVDDGEIPF